MRPSATLAFFISLLLAGLAGFGTAQAQTWFTIDQCDSVQIAGKPYSRITFTVHNIFQPTDVINSFSMQPATYQAPGDTCHVLQIAAPTGWLPLHRGDGGPGWFANAPGVSILPGSSLGGFQMTISRPECCYLAGFTSVFDSPFAFGTGCFVCPLPTPARSASWGQLKTQYR